MSRKASKQTSFTGQYDSETSIDLLAESKWNLVWLLKRFIHIDIPLKVQMTGDALHKPSSLHNMLAVPTSSYPGLHIRVAVEPTVVLPGGVSVTVPCAGVVGSPQSIIQIEPCSIAPITACWIRISK